MTTQPTNGFSHLQINGISLGDRQGSTRGMETDQRLEKSTPIDCSKSNGGVLCNFKQMRDNTGELKMQQSREKELEVNSKN